MAVWRMKKRKRLNKKKTRKFWGSIILLVVLVGGMYVLMLPEGAARFAVLRSGHPLAALTAQLTEEGYPNDLEDGQIGYVLEDAPYDRDYRSVMETWIVDRHGMIYIGEYDDR